MWERANWAERTWPPETGDSVHELLTAIVCGVEQVVCASPSVAKSEVQTWTELVPSVKGGAAVSRFQAAFRTGGQGDGVVAAMPV